MRVLVAFDKFKDALSAPEACSLAAAALRADHPGWEIDACPLTDGGDGFAEILTRAAQGRLRRCPVVGPRDEPASATLGLVASANIPSAARARLSFPPSAAPLAVIDLASASGLALLAPARRDPWQTSTFGTGELIRAAAEAGAAAILLGVGGSATNDLGLGALAALGLEFLSAQGEKIVPPIPARWGRIAGLSGRVAPDLPPLFLACDVANPLLGPRGCAAIFGAQKGLAAVDRPRLEHESARLARLLCTQATQPDSIMDLPGAGAAGGIAFGLKVGAGATWVAGFDLVADWLDLDRRLAAADLVLTGEGRFDESSLGGKGPGAIVARAQKFGRTAHVFAGSVADGGLPPGVALHALTPADWPLEKALAATGPLLTAAIRRQFP